MKDRVFISHKGNDIELFRPDVETILKGGEKMQSCINKVKGYRNMVNLSQEELATILGITRRTYVEKENGSAKFTIDELVKIRDTVNSCGLSITLDDLSL